MNKVLDKLLIRKSSQNKPKYYKESKDLLILYMSHTKLMSRILLLFHQRAVSNMIRMNVFLVYSSYLVVSSTFICYPFLFLVFQLECHSIVEKLSKYSCDENVFRSQ